MRNLLQRQATFEKTLHRVQEASDEKFFLLVTKIADTRKSVEDLRDVVDARLKAIGETIRQLDFRLIIMSNCLSIQRQFEIMVDKIHNYTSYLNLAYMHLKSCPASFLSYNTSIYSAVSSLSFEFVPPNFLHTRSTCCNRRGPYHRRDPPRYEVDTRDSSWFWGYLLQSPNCARSHCFATRPLHCLRYTGELKSSTFDVYRAIPLHQPNEDATTASVYRFSHEFLAIANDDSQYAELRNTTLSQCSGTNRIKLCRKGFSTTTYETLLCLTSLFYEYSIPTPRNCLVDSVLLPETPQASYLADGLYHVIYRTARLQVKNNTDGVPVYISTL